jgi:hypothetical protein
MTNQRSKASLFLACPSVLLAALAAGCAGTSDGERSLPAPAQVVEEASARATVVSVEPRTRHVGLRSEEGITWIVQAGPEVRNFDQIAVGDTVLARYHQALAVTLVRPGESAVPASAALAAGRAAPGATPAAGIAGGITATVRIESIDTEANIVVFTGPTGELRALRVERPEGREFIKDLERGDQVEITYVEALALSLEKQ